MISFLCSFFSRSGDPGRTFEVCLCVSGLGVFQHGENHVGGCPDDGWEASFGLGNSFLAFGRDGQVSTREFEDSYSCECPKLFSLFFFGDLICGNTMCWSGMGGTLHFEHMFLKGELWCEGAIAPGAKSMPPCPWSRPAKVIVAQISWHPKWPNLPTRLPLQDVALNALYYAFSDLSRTFLLRFSNKLCTVRLFY